jgi:hypothetical protein
MALSIWKAIPFIFTFLFLKEIKGQVISTFAGTGTLGYSGNGGSALKAELATPWGVTFSSCSR